MLTQPGQMVGTLDYLAPEMHPRRAATPAEADLYALGCVVYECAGGHSRRSGAKSMFEVGIAHLGTRRRIRAPSATTRRRS